jgi:hypothetical protein
MGSTVFRATIRPPKRLLGNELLKCRKRYFNSQLPGLMGSGTPPDFHKQKQPKVLPSQTPHGGDLRLLLWCLALHLPWF